MTSIYSSLLYPLVLRCSGCTQIWHAHSALLAASEQSTMSEPTMHKRLRPFWFSIRLLQWNRLVEDLVVRDSFLVEKLFIVYVACRNQAHFWLCSSDSIDEYVQHKKRNENCKNVLLAKSTRLCSHASRWYKSDSRYGIWRRMSSAFARAQIIAIVMVDRKVLPDIQKTERVELFNVLPLSQNLVGTGYSNFTVCRTDVYGIEIRKRRVQKFRCV